MRKVQVLPYNEYWTNMFQEESVKLMEVFGSETLNIYHIGSTAIPYIHAKPVIDIIVEVKSIGNVDMFNFKMEQ